MNDMKRRACDAIDEMNPRLRSVSRELFDHPELKSEEIRASKRLSEELRSAGFRVELGAGGLATAIRAEHPSVSAGPTIAILAEYDALPEIGHACGHNLIAAGGLGAALAVGALKSELPGRLLFFGTPAEEGGGGKVAMVEQGLFRDVDAAMMFHPAPFTVVGHGSLAITEVGIEFYGVPAHASAWPDRGINALDAVIQTFNGVNALRQHIRDGARIHGIITHGGAQPNIVPEYAAAEFYVRAAETAYRDELLDKLRRCAEGAALATGARLEFAVISLPYKSMKPNRTIGAAFAENLAAIGWALDDPRGKDLPMGSTDMGDVSQTVPAIHPYIAICDPDIVGHSREFAVASASDRGHDAMIVAAKAMAMTAIDLFDSPGLVSRAREEFAA
jgi:amidohydrolase